MYVCQEELYSCFTNPRISPLPYPSFTLKQTYSIIIIKKKEKLLLIYDQVKYSHSFSSLYNSERSFKKKTNEK